MFIQKIRTFAQFVGFAVVGVLMLYGAVAAINNVGGVFAASPNASAASPQRQAGAGAVPSILNYQGMLRDPEGNPMNGLYGMTFRIYTEVTAPTNEAIWTGQYNEVSVRGGQFSVVLGDSTALPANAFTSPDRFIGITVAPYDEMVPRQRFASVPYAIYADHSVSAADADTLDGLDGNAYAKVGQINALNNANNGAANALYVNATGAVGIGTTAPASKLHVEGPSLKLQNGASSVDVSTSGENTSIAANGNLEISAQNGAKLIQLSKYVDIGKKGQAQGLVNVYGNLRLNEDAPVLIKRFSNIGDNADVDTLVTTADYYCVAGGWAAKYDINESGSNINMVWTYASGGKWRVRVVLASHNENENVDVDIMCFHRMMTTFVGTASLNSPD